jgi:hypothetical protein
LVPWLPTHLQRPEAGHPEGAAAVGCDDRLRDQGEQMMKLARRLVPTMKSFNRERIPDRFRLHAAPIPPPTGHAAG